MAIAYPGAPAVAKSRPKARLHIEISFKAVAIALNSAVVLVLFGLACWIRHIGSIPGVFNGADLLAIILIACAVGPACNVYRFARMRKPSMPEERR